MQLTTAKVAQIDDTEGDSNFPQPVMEIGTGLDDKRQTAIQEQESTIPEQLERAKRAGWMMRVRISGTAMTSGTIGCITGIVMLLDLPGLLNTIVHRGNADRCEYRALTT